MYPRTKGCEMVFFLACCLCCTLEPQEAICIRREFSRSPHLVYNHPHPVLHSFSSLLVHLFLDLSPTTPLQSESQLEFPFSNRSCVSVRASLQPRHRSFSP